MKYQPLLWLKRCCLFFFLIIASWTYTMAQTSELVGHWKLDESSGTALADASTFGNNATLLNAGSVGRVPGVYGLALSLPGTSSRYAAVPNAASLNITDKITIAAWISPTELGDRSIVSKTGGGGYELTNAIDGTIVFKINDDTEGSKYTIASNSHYPTNGTTWMHVAATFDGSSSKIYINGVLDNSVTFSTPTTIRTNTSELKLGALLTIHRWKGLLDDIRVYHGALTAAEIVQAMNNNSTPPPAVPAIPILNAPANAATGVAYNPTLSWNAAAGATKYLVELSTVSNFSTTVISQDNIAATSLATSNLQPNTTYYWRVKAGNGTGYSNWSTVWSFTTAPLPVPAVPLLSAPLNAATGVAYNPTLSWSAATGATKYLAELSTVSNFATTGISQDNIVATNLPTSNLQPNTTYYWRVKAGNAGGYSNWSAVWSFTTAPLPVPAVPLLSAPANAATGVASNPTLVWSAATNATKYLAELSTVSTFATTLISQDNIATTSLLASGLQPSTTCYWRVKAGNVSGYSNWSAVFSFTTAAPPPPTTSELVGHWKLDESSGTALADASTFGNNATLLNAGSVGRVPGVYGLALSLPGTSSRYAAVPNAASLNITDKITIAAWISPTELGDRSIVSKTGGGGYELTNAIDGTIVFKINDDTEGSKYTVVSNSHYPTNGTTWMHVAATFDGSSSKIYINGVLDNSVTFSTPTTIRTNTSELKLGALLTIHRWKGLLDDIRVYHGALTAAEIVQAMNNNSTPPPAVPAIPILNAPANAATGVAYNPTLSWNAAAGATKYLAELSTVSNFSTTVISQDNIAATSLATSNLQPNTIYYWRVKAGNAGGYSNWSTVWSFTTAPLPVPAVPLLSAPLNAATGVAYNPTLSWNLVTDATKYLAELSTVSNFATTVISQDNIAATNLPTSNLQPNTTYYWRVKAGNAGGYSDWSTVFSFTTAPIPVPAIPTLSAPVNAATDVASNPTLAWVAVNGATKYLAELSTVSSFATTLISQDNIATTSLQASGLQPSTTYYWRVKAGNATGYSDWSAVFSFTTAGTPPASLTLLHYWNFNNAAALTTPTISLVNGIITTSLAATSTTEVGTANSFTGENARNGDDIGSHFRLNNPIGSVLQLNVPTTGFADILVKYETRRSGSGAELQKISYTLDGTNYIALQNVNVIDGVPALVSLNFASITGANNNANFKIRIEFEQGVGGTVGNNRFDNVTVEGNQQGSIPLPSIPTLSAPANAATGVSVNPTLQWNTTNGAAKYLLELATTAAFSTTVISQDDINTTSLPVATALQANTTYYWRVKAGNTTGYSDWSAVFSFTTAGTPPASLTLFHYWNFNNAAALTTPTISLVNGTITTSLAATSTTEAGTANSFTGENARNGDDIGSHFRLNNPIGSILQLNIPTTGFADILVKYEARRSGSGAELQKISYTLDGTNYIALQTVNVIDGVPALVSLNFASITGANNNANFKIQIEFEQGVGGTVGNNRFDNITVEGQSQGGIPAPGQVVTTSPADNEQNVKVKPVLSWQDATGATAYQVQVSTTNQFTTLLVDKTVSGTTSYKLENALNLATNYFWRVKASNSTGDGPWSTVKTFRTVTELIVYQIAINEVMSSNTSVITDDDGGYEDWIELYNYGSTPVNLQGFGLTDLPSNPFKWVFPSKIIAPGEYLLVWATSKNRTDPAHDLHTNFGISSAGEEIMLTDPDGEMVDVIPNVVIPTNVSRGHDPDGTGELKFFMVPTPNASNSGGISEIITKASFSVPPGVYQSNVNLSITHPDPGVVIRYTLDGSEPKATSPVYPQSLNITDRSGDPNSLSLIPTNLLPATNSRGWNPPNGLVRKATVIKAKAFKANGSQSETITGSYIVLSGRQFTLPVISVVAPVDSLFGYERGIYVPGTNYFSSDYGSGNYYRKGDDWERPGTLEFFSPDLTFQQSLAYRINGDYSRRFPQKSLRLVAKSKYGSSSINYPVFTDLNNASFKRLELTNTGNDWGNTLFRDALASKMVNHIMPAEHNRPAVVFLDGEYWGIHNLREHADKFYLARIYGIDPDNIDYLSRQLEIEEGQDIYYKQMLNYIQTTDLTTPAGYDGVKKLMDVDNYIDYYSAEIYYANTDWPQSNIEYWRSRVPYNPAAPAGQDGRWRWILHDLDQTFYDPTYNSVQWVTAAINPDENSEWPNLLLRRLLTNQDFKNEFINRISDHLNTAFIPARLTQAADSMRTLLQDEIPEHILRWRQPSSASSWSGKVDGIKTFAVQRPANLRQHLRDAFALGSNLTVTLDVNNKAQGSIKLNSLLIKAGAVGVNATTPYPWQGTYFSNVPLKLKAVPEIGFAFDHWVINGQSNPEESYVYTPTANSSITAYFVATTGVTPVLTAPANAVKNVSKTPTDLSWQAVSQATTYRLQLAYTADFAAPVYDQNNITSTSASVTGLRDTTLYYWRVMAKGPNGFSDWSAIWTFTTTPSATPYPAIVTLLSPANAATNLPVITKLTWNASQNATYYTVQVSDEADFGSLLVNTYDVQSPTYTINGLVRNKIYYWRVKAGNDRGNTAWSETFRFRTAPMVYSSDLVGYWDLNEEGAKYLLDKSGNGNTATMQIIDEISWPTGAEGLGLNLPGASNMFAIAANSSSLNITNQITIAVWIRPIEVATRTIISKTGQNGYELGTSSTGKIEFRFNGDASGNTYRLRSLANYVADGNTWTHVTATFDGITSKIYINGVLDNSVTYAAPATILSNTSGLYIGALRGSNRWKGTLDDIQLYKRALSAAEIMNLVNPGVVNASQSTPLMVEAITNRPETYRVTPNPVKESLNLDLPDGTSGEATITITDVLGRVYHHADYSLNKSRVLINTSRLRLNPGIYFVSVSTGDTTQSVKFLKE